MKTFHRIIAMCVLFITASPAIIPALAQEPAVTVKNGLVITGTVRDRETRRKLENVTVVLAGSSIGTVTNDEGFFSLKIPASVSAPQLELSHIGYRNTQFSATVPEGTADMATTIWMTPAFRQLDEAVICGGDARSIVEEALRRIPANYPDSDNMMSAFYRETVQKGQRYIAVSEAMMDVYKTSYVKRTMDRDKVQILRARRLLSQEKSDTLAVKVAGGPSQPVIMDVVKNGDALFDEKTLDYYSFAQEASVMIDDRMQYVISFHPCVITS